MCVVYAVMNSMFLVEVNAEKSGHTMATSSASLLRSVQGVQASVLLGHPWPRPSWGFVPRGINQGLGVTTTEQEA